MDLNDISPLAKNLILPNDRLRHILIVGGTDKDRLAFAQAMGIQSVMLNHDVAFVSSQETKEVVLSYLFKLGKSRYDLPEEKRTPLFVYMNYLSDQNDTSPDLASLLSEGRSCKIGLTISIAQLDQLTSNNQMAVLGNVGSIICLKLVASDAVKFVEYFDNKFTSTEFSNIPAGEAIVKLIKNGVQEAPFRLKLS